MDTRSFEDVFGTDEEEVHPSYNSYMRRIEKANIAISLDYNNDLQIIKNRYGNNTYINEHQAKQLIAKIVSNVIINRQSIFKFFKGTLDLEIFEACDKIFKKWGVDDKKIIANPEDPEYEVQFDDFL